jgi:hypothetical protein
MSKKKISPFYCYKKMCRKTAWDTPEYMAEQDWVTLRKFRNIIAAKNLESFMVLQDDQTEWNSFFYHMVGWPEGRTYCQDWDYARKTFLAGVSNHMLPQIDKALAAKGA